jgi:hypothetical protein
MIDLEKADGPNERLMGLVQRLRFANGENTNMTLFPEYASEVADDIEALLRQNDQLLKLNSNWAKTTTDLSYKMYALVDMLGPKAREVWRGWVKRGVTRVHFSWGPDAGTLTGEERAQIILDSEKNATRMDSAPMTDRQKFTLFQLDRLETKRFIQERFGDE